MITASNVHECNICGRGMPHSYSSMKYHLSKFHEMSVSSYYEQYKEDIDWEPISLPITDQSLLGQSSTQKDRCQASWLNKCTYTCKICNTNLMTSHAGFLSHIQLFHQETTSSYAVNFGKEFVSKLDSHTCQLCGTVLGWDRTLISKHLSRLHPSVSIKEYIQTYKDTYSDNPVLSEKEDEAWMNGCVFQCRKCKAPKYLTTRSKLVHHLHHEHQLNLNDCTGGSIFKKFALYSCLICKKSMRWDSDSITAHLDKVHSITPEVYARDHLKESKDKTIEEAKRAGKPSRGRRGSDWLNRCSFSCKQCPYITEFYQSFLSHISTEHNLNTKDYKDRNNGEFYTKVVYHFCQICGYAMIWNRDCISRHLRNKHKTVSAKKYEEMFKACYNEDKVFDESDDRKWMNRCKLACKECNDHPSFESKDMLTLHLYKVHSMTLTTYHGRHSMLYSFYELYTCKVCDKAIRWESDTIIGHLSKLHKMSPELYSSEVLNGDLMTHLKELDKSPKVYVAGNSNKNFSNWLNKFSYRCQSCPFTTSYRKSFVKHLSKSHSMTGKEFSKLNGGKLFSSTVINHTCQLCGLILAWEKRIIGNHLNTMHHSVTTKVKETSL